MTLGAGNKAEPSTADTWRDVCAELGGEAFHLATCDGPTNATWEQYARARLKWLAGMLARLSTSPASPISGPILVLDDQENIDWKSRFDSSQALLARRTEALEPFAKVGRALTGRAVSYSISARPGVSAPLVDANDFRRAFEALSLVLVDEGDRGTSSFVADSGSTASPKSDGAEGH